VLLNTVWQRLDTFVGIHASGGHGGDIARFWDIPTRVELVEIVVHVCEVEIFWELCVLVNFVVRDFAHLTPAGDFRGVATVTGTDGREVVDADRSLASSVSANLTWMLSQRMDRIVGPGF
jgi:hypothetical protein